MAARAEGVRIAAIQHGMIYRWHNGYMHRDRPAELSLVDRTYVFGEWERRLLIDHSVYREDEVEVGGSPRLDLAGPQVDRTRRGPRRARASPPATGSSCCPGRGARSTAGSTTRSRWPASSTGRCPNVHLVVKLHPGEPDEGPYRAVIEASRPPAASSRRRSRSSRPIDLYRLLARRRCAHRRPVDGADRGGRHRHAEPARRDVAGVGPARATSRPASRSRSGPAATCWRPSMPAGRGRDAGGAAGVHRRPLRARLRERADRRRPPGVAHA